MSDGEVDIDGELPEGWRTVRLGDVISVKGGKRLPAGSDYSEEPTKHPYIRVVDFSNGSVRSSDLRYIDEPTHRAISRYIIRSSDVYISIAGTIGVTGRVPDKLDGANLTENAAKLTPTESVDPDYLWRALSSPELQSEIKDSTIATTQPKLALFRIEELPLPLPPLPEQRRIVAKLESLHARSRRAREALEAVPPLLEKLRQSILAAAFRGDLTADWRVQHPDVEPASELLKRIRIERRKKWEQAELAKLKAKGKKPTDDKWKQKYVEPDEPNFQNGKPDLPDEWVWASVADLTECLDGRRVPITRADRKAGPYPYYGANGQVDSVAKYLFDEPLVLVTEDETFYGRTKPIAYRVDGKCWVNNHAHVLRPVSPLEADFVCDALMHYPVTRWLSGTTGRAKLTQGALNTLPIALPPFEEQVEILRRVSRALKAEPNLELWTREAVASVGKLDALVLSKAFRGELVPQDPSEVISTPFDIETTSAVSAPDQTSDAKSSTRSTPPSRSRHR